MYDKNIDKVCTVLATRKCMTLYGFYRSISKNMVRYVLRQAKIVSLFKERFDYEE